MELTGRAATDGARTTVDKAPVVVGVPLNGPCDVAPVTWEETTEGVIDAAEVTVVVAEEANGIAMVRAAKARRLAPEKIADGAMAMLYNIGWTTEGKRDKLDRWKKIQALYTEMLDGKKSDIGNDFTKGRKNCLHCMTASMGICMSTAVELAPISNLAG